jgi:hypothetical protein|tara:strand:+ start:971 stop:1399 length:429 start_codon:yes stop_codon:yes gene_type:complete
LKIIFSLKPLIGLGLSSLVFTSCGSFSPANEPEYPLLNTNHILDAALVARIKANEEAAARRAALKKKNEEETVKTTTDPPDVLKKDPVKPKSKYRTAVAIPGKPGFVFNPWTNKAVDVRGVPGGMLVRDPNDGNPDHKFRVP